MRTIGYYISARHIVKMSGYQVLRDRKKENVIRFDLSLRRLKHLSCPAHHAHSDPPALLNCSHLLSKCTEDIPRLFLATEFYILLLFTANRVFRWMVEF